MQPYINLYETLKVHLDIPSGELATKLTVDAQFRPSPVGNTFWADCCECHQVGCFV